MFPSYMTCYTKYLYCHIPQTWAQLYLICIMCINELGGEYVELWIGAANAIVGLLDAQI